MRVYRSIFPLVLLFGGAVACSAALPADGPADDPVESEDAVTKSGSVRIYDRHSGSTVQVTAGKAVYLYLDVELGPGRTWSVTQVSRTLGYPSATSWLDGPNGDDTRMRFKWDTTGFQSKLGTHPITLAYGGEADQSPTKTFSVTLVVVDSTAVVDGGAAPDGASEQAVDGGSAVDAGESAARLPVCTNVGTRSQGWAWSDGTGFIGWDSSCHMTAPECRYDGSAAEGWYRADTRKLIALGDCTGTSVPR